jgi:hypothetical protein
LAQSIRNEHHADTLVGAVMKTVSPANGNCYFDRSHQETIQQRYMSNIHRLAGRCQPQQLSEQYSPLTPGTPPTLPPSGSQEPQFEACTGPFMSAVRHLRFIFLEMFCLPKTKVFSSQQVTRLGNTQNT